jgi:hypothetical protein
MDRDGGCRCRRKEKTAGWLEDFVREAVALVARELTEGKCSDEIGAALGERDEAVGPVALPVILGAAPVERLGLNQRPLACEAIGSAPRIVRRRSPRGTIDVIRRASDGQECARIYVDSGTRIRVSATRQPGTPSPRSRRCHPGGPARLPVLPTFRLPAVGLSPPPGG